MKTRVAGASMARIGHNVIDIAVERRRIPGKKAGKQEPK